MKLENIILILSVAIIFNIMILYFIIDSITNKINILNELLLDIQENIWEWGMIHVMMDNLKENKINQLRTLEQEINDLNDELVLKHRLVTDIIREIFENKEENN